MPKILIDRFRLEKILVGLEVQCYASTVAPEAHDAMRELRAVLDEAVVQEPNEATNDRIEDLLEDSKMLRRIASLCRSQSRYLGSYEEIVRQALSQQEPRGTAQPEGNSI